MAPAINIVGLSHVFFNVLLPMLDGTNGGYDVKASGSDDYPPSPEYFIHTSRVIVKHPTLAQDMIKS